MTEIDNLRYERCVVPKHGDIVDMQLHGFGDASEAGYAACIYLRSSTVNSVTVRLVCAKTKVAPVKKCRYRGWSYVQLCLLPDF